MENENVYQGGLCNLIDIFNYQNGSDLHIPPHRRLIDVYFDQCDVGDIGFDTGESNLGESSQPQLESYTDEGRDIGQPEWSDVGPHSEAEVYGQSGYYGEGDVGESSHNIGGEAGQTPHSETGDYGSDQGSQHEVIEEMGIDPRGSDISHRSHRGSRSDVGSHGSHHASGSSSGRSSQGSGKSGLFSCFGFDCFRGKNGKS
nr:unnamed protein product [Meloidogyne enterolobii]CAD2183161.1 unnamed protein product [Meloidogyne enterolobii]